MLQDTGEHYEIHRKILFICWWSLKEKLLKLIVAASGLLTISYVHLVAFK